VPCVSVPSRHGGLELRHLIVGLYPLDLVRIHLLMHNINLLPWHPWVGRHGIQMKECGWEQPE
jgi:hypothetical protein